MLWAVVVARGWGGEGAHWGILSTVAVASIRYIGRKNVIVDSRY